MRAAGLNGKQVAVRLGWTESQVSRVLVGRRSVSVVDMSALLAVCRVVGPERVRLMRLCDESGTPALRHHYWIRLPEEEESYLVHEREAARITDVQSVVFPRALRMGARSDLSGPWFDFFVHEWVLRTPVGPPDMMSEQLHHLLRMSVLPRVSLRIVRAIPTGPFTLLDFDGFPSAVYREGIAEGMFCEAPAEVAAHRRIVSLLRGDAMDQERSRALITQAATDLCGAGSFY
jgi:hypothetical protein